MKHLIMTIGGMVSLSDCHKRLREAHDYLVAHTGARLREMGDAASMETWGTRAKRMHVKFSMENRPLVIGTDVSEHNVMEVVNQCATIERMLDVLSWTQKPESGLAAYRVEQSNPTTTWGGEDAEGGMDHDLVLADATGQLAKFEISDVAGSGDGNNKEKSDLQNLGVLSRDMTWPSGRLFLAVSKDMGERMAKKKTSRTAKNYKYLPPAIEGETYIFEITQVE